MCSRPGMPFIDSSVIDKPRFGGVCRVRGACSTIRMEFSVKINAVWSRPLKLKKDKSGKFTYIIDLKCLPHAPGVYVFARQHGENIVPIYIGETVSVQGRVKNHLKSVPLMNAIERAPRGSRFLIYCTVQAGTVEKAKKHGKVIERALILHAQSQGHELFNRQGTKLPADEISFSGNRTSEAIAPRTMLIKKALVGKQRG